MAVFLTFAVFLIIINDSLPTTDTSPSLITYVYTHLVPSGFTVLSQALVLRQHYRDVSRNTISYVNRVEGLFNKQPARRSNDNKLDTTFLSLSVVINVVSFSVFLVATRKVTREGPPRE